MPLFYFLLYEFVESEQVKYQLSAAIIFDDGGQIFSFKSHAHVWASSRIPEANNVTEIPWSGERLNTHNTFSNYFYFLYIYF